MKQKPKTEKELSKKILIKSDNLFPVVGIGASAGGLDAFKKLLKAIPENSGMAYVLVQHLDPKHESLLPKILQKVTPIPVLEITHDIKVKPDHIYVIPSNKMMVATDGVLVLAPRPPKSKTQRNLPIDLFFASLAEVHQEHAIGVVLSGTASDGTQGLKAIKEQGGITFAQDEASAEYDGMPHSAAKAGVVDFILPPEEIPKKLLEVTSKSILSDEELQNIPKEDEDAFKQILSLLRIRKGVDFTYYKQTTIRRRILRRMVVNKNEETSEYLKFLRGNNPEQDLLYQDMLIPVTSFFRDKKVFESLCNKVFPAIVKNKVPGEITRVWVAGCSTGQEVYSFAICFKEFLGDNHERIQIFGTDLSEPAILKARTGFYEKTELDSISPERLKEYFTKSNGGYLVNKSIRDLCVFAHHNFLKDPPFGKMDCISCRNVLIYMEPYLQKKALTTFHYALNPRGFLLLGKSETTGGVPDLFAAEGKSDKLYTRKDVPSRFMQVTSQRSEQILTRPANSSKSETIRTDFQKTADDILLTKYTPAGVVVNEAMDIVHFRGNTTNYLEQAPGKPSHNLLMMAKHGLGFELRNILHKAKTDKVAVVKENIPLHVNGSLRNISIEAVPLPNTLEPYYLLLFHDHNLTDAAGSVTVSKRKVSAKTKQDEKDIRIQLLEQELSQLREDMRSITEEQEASNEELQSANEELLSGSEELQSLNEELETSKEELQSTNEELTVLNHELVGLNEQVTDARNYSESIVATLYQPLLVLDKHLRVKTANKAFYKTFNVNEQETEGVLIYDLGNRQWNIPELRTLLEEVLPQKKQITDFEVTHNFTSIGERIILLNALELTREKKEEKLILLSIEDITEQRHSQVKEKNFLSRFHNLLLQTSVPIAIFRGSNYIVELVNDSGLGLMVKDKSFIGKLLFEASPELEKQFKEILDKVMESGIPFNANEMEITLFRNGRNETGWFNLHYQPIREDDNSISGILASANEITDQVLARKKIEVSEHRYHEMISSSPSMIAILKGEDMIIEIANDAVLESWGKGKDLIGKSIFDAVPETVEQGFDKLLLSTYKTGHPFRAYETPVTLLRNGTKELVYYNFIYQAQRDIMGNIEGVAIIASEVTPQAELNKKIKASEAFNRTVLESSPDCIKILDADGRLQFMNSNGICLLEIDDFEPLKNTYWSDMWEPDKQQIIKDAITAAKKGEKIQLQLFGPTVKGTPKWWDIIVSPVLQDESDKNLHQILSVSRDITKQKLNELKERELLARFQNLVLQAPIAICVIRGKKYVVEIVNEGMLEFWGRTEAQVLNKPIFEVLTELEDQGFEALVENVYTSGERFVANELPVTLLRKGRLENAYVTFVYEPLREVDGTISGIMVIAHEITDLVVGRKKMEVQTALFEDMLMTAPGFVCTLRGPNHIYELVNEQYQSLFPNRQIKGKPLLSAFPELEGQGFKELMYKVYTTGEPYVGIDIPVFIARNEGLTPELRYFNFSYQAMYDEYKNIYSILNFGYEVTEQVVAKNKNLESRKIREAELENQVQKRTIELSKVNLKLQKINNEKEQRSQELIIANKKLEKESKEKEKKAKELIIANIKLEFESKEKEKKAKELIIANEKLGFESSEKEKRAAELVIANHELAFQNDEKEKRTSELVIANKELLAFNYISSHDLQEPLRKIQTFSTRIIEKEFETLSANGKDYFTRINSSARRMQTLIEDLLTYSHTNITDRKFEKVDFEELIKEIVKDLKETIKTKKAKVNFSGDKIAKISRFQFRQVLNNLIGNALKFSRSDVNPIITITGKIDLGKSFKSEKDSAFPILLSTDKKYFQLKFTDNGIGFDPKYSTKIFDVFQRLHGKEEYAGTGIGLAIVKKIIDNHNGFISASGKINEGATFTIYIPM